MCRGQHLRLLLTTDHRPPTTCPRPLMADETTAGPDRSMAGATWVREPDGDQRLEENWLFRLRRERFRSRASGRTHDYYVMHLADAVNVIALTPNRRVIL